MTLEQRRVRLAERLAEVELWRDRASVAIDGWSFDGEPFALGSPWPTRHDPHLLEAHGIAVPDDWPLAEARVDLDLGGEGLVHIRYPDGTGSRWGLDPNHHRIPVLQRDFDLSVHAVARLPFGEPNREPRLVRARLAWPDLAVDRFARQLFLVLEAAEVLGDDEVTDPLLGCAERALALVEWPSGTRGYVSHSAPSVRLRDIWELPADLDPWPAGLSDTERDSVVAASSRLEHDLNAVRERYPKRGALLLTGHAHLDLAWLWPIEETRRKALRTWWTAVNLLAAHPELTFNQSSAQLYSWVEADDPELYARVEQAVQSGRWEPIGGMWVEADVNLPCGESLARQLLYGQRFFERAFGTRHRVGWLPDSFGLSGGLPQLLVSAGITSLFSQKLNRADTNRFPYDLYWWEGLDGTRLLVHSFDNPDGSYDAKLGPDSIVRTWRNFRAKHLHPESLLSIGYGDGGGGPTEEMVTRAQELDSLPALPRVAFGRVDEFFDRMRALTPEPVPVWVGELYLEFHRGTYTTQGRVKWLHRRAERTLVAAESVGVLAALAGAPTASPLAEAWRTLLLNQFHDILPGSSIREVNEEAERSLENVVVVAGKAIGGGLDALAARVEGTGEADGVLVVNPELTPRPLRLTAPDDLPGAQPVADGWVVAAQRRVAGLEAATVVDLAPPAGLRAGDRHLENAFVRAELDETGALLRLYDKVSGREVLAGRANQLWAYVDKPRVFDAWEVEADYLDAGVELLDVESVSLVESGSHRAAVRVTRRFRASRIVQEIRMWANSPRIDFATRIEWHDRHWLLKARFPLAVRSDHATFETAFGVVRRPTHRNTPWDAAKFEVPAHRFVDLSEPGYGVALVNDGRYGHHALGNELGITLLRSPVYPDPYADEGAHSFSYALFPHPGGWEQAGTQVLAEAEDLNQPLLARRVRAVRAGSYQPVRLSGLPLGLGALKPAEDGGGYVLRCYEPRGARGAAEVGLAAGWGLTGELNVLEDRTGSPETTFTPFQVRTWHITPVGPKMRSL